MRCEVVRATRDAECRALTVVCGRREIPKAVDLLLGMAACAECGVQSLSLAADLANPSVSYCNSCWEAYEQEVDRKRLIATATKILKPRI